MREVLIFFSDLSFEVRFAEEFMRDDIHVVVDSLSCVADTDLKNDPRVHELRLMVRHGEIEWYDGDKTIAEMLQLIEASGKLPTTSQPPLGEIIALYTELVQAGKKVIVLNVDHVLSGTHETCKMAARQVMQEVKGADIRVFDMLTASSPIAGMAMDVLDRIEAGDDMDALEAYIKNALERTNSFFSVDTLEYLQKGGRIGKLSGLIGGILGIRPIVNLGVHTDGQLVPADKCRTRKKVLKRMVELAHEQGELERIYVANCECPEDAQSLAETMQQDYPGVPVLSTGIGTVLAAHLGPGAIGLFVRKK